MTAEIIFASNKLGNINNDQIQSMLKKYNLGKLISSSRTENGAMGQTMFLLTTEGEFVLKGNPLYNGQLTEEKYFIENIKMRTNVRVPLPYIIDESEDIFGWSYSIMPRLKGEHINAATFKEKLDYEDQLMIAETIAKTLSSFHSWKVSSFGELDTTNLSITPFKNSYTDWLFNRIIFWLEDAKKYSKITAEDIEWAKALLADSEKDFQLIESPTFVMGDLKPGNFLVQKGKNSWEISGVFDFTNSYFADPLSDLIKMCTYYIDNNEKEIANHFLYEYCGELKEKSNLKNRLKIHMLHQKVLDWGNAKATKLVTWDDELSFTKWMTKYTDFIDDFS